MRNGSFNKYGHYMFSTKNNSSIAANVFMPTRYMYIYVYTFVCYIQKCMQENKRKKGMINIWIILLLGWGEVMLCDSTEKMNLSQTRWTNLMKMKRMKDFNNMKLLKQWWIPCWTEGLWEQWTDKRSQDVHWSMDWMMPSLLNVLIKISSKLSGPSNVSQCCIFLHSLKVGNRWQWMDLSLKHKQTTLT